MPPALELDELESHRGALLRFAMIQLRDASHAEDCVQETLSAAVQGADRFAGESSVRTWLIGILKHKILDHFRRASRERPLPGTGNETSLDDFDALFRENGHFLERPADWGNPEQALAEQEFFTILEECLDRLPRNTALVFKMREVMGIEVSEICKELGITPNNCWVMIYRARMSLRQCLEARWFGAQARR